MELDRDPRGGRELKQDKAVAGDGQSVEEKKYGIMVPENDRGRLWCLI